MAGIAGAGKLAAMKQMAEKMGSKRPMKGKKPMVARDDMGALAAFASKKKGRAKGY